MIHAFHRGQDFDQTFAVKMMTEVNHMDAMSEPFKVMAFVRPKRKSLEERNHDLDQIVATLDQELVQIFSVIVVPAVLVEPANSEEITESLKRFDTASALDDSEPVNHLPAQTIALTIATAGLAHQADGEAALSINEAENPANRDQSFLLIACTGRIVTHASIV